jgi:hypothetical protein
MKGGVRTEYLTRTSVHAPGVQLAVDYHEGQARRSREDIGKMHAIPAHGGGVLGTVAYKVGRERAVRRRLRSAQHTAWPV